MSENPRGVRVAEPIWTASAERIEKLKGPVAVTLTLKPGDTRNGAIKAFLRALLDATEG